MIARRVEDIRSFLVMDVMAEAEKLEKAGEEVIHLEVGEPDFATPAAVQDAAIAAMRTGATHYTHALGTLALREEICRHYADEYGVTVTPDRVMVTCGTSPAMLLMMLATVDQGDEVIVSNPRYSCYPNFVRAAGGTLVEVQTLPEEGFQYRPEAVRERLTARTRGILVNSPSNPTGMVMTEQNLRDMAAIEGPYLFSDEIYHGLVYEGRARSILEFTDRAFVINGFSKLWAMTGWRLGWLIFPREFSGIMEKLHQNFAISAGAFVQAAGVAALRDTKADVARMVKLYDERRRYMIGRLRDLGFVIHREPTGAFYVFADARHFCSDSYREAFSILRSVKVGVTPGIDFGTGGEGYLRFSYASSLANIREGLNRIERYIRDGRCHA